mmetsp:Transcript_21824/g.56817  ORF Transcript_21824/g.56817 Transcript_21824/m.56817 type:complete len:232 (+) Transcript_21824:165-860(+)
MVRTRVAYCRLFCVSSMLLSVGDTLTNMSVLALPPRQSESSMVSLWLRYGMWVCSEASALMTSPSADSDLLMACASLSCSPVEPLFLMRSLPARSTKLSLPLVTACVCRLVPSITKLITRWLRLDSRFIAVPATWRRCWPNSMASRSSLALVTSMVVAPCTVTSPLASFLMSSFGAPGPRLPGSSRSCSVSWYSSSMQHLTLYVHLLESASMLAKSWLMARGVRPGSASLP